MSSSTRLVFTFLTLALGLACSSFAKNSKSPTPTHANVAYDSHERTVLDFWQAEGPGPRPLLIYIHGGGWLKGDKRAMRNAEVYLEKGISVASVNYRLLETDILPTPVHDTARAVQFLRSKAGEWNIDKNKVVLSGGSAGGCSSLWIACRDDLAKPDSKDPVERESSRVQGAGVLSAQTSIDPPQIEPWIGPKVFLSMIYKAVGENSVEDMKRNYAQHEALFKEFSPINHLSKDDPPLFLEYPDKPEFMAVPAASLNYGIHHGLFGIKMKERAAEVGHNKVELLIKDHDESDAYANVDDFIFKTLIGRATASAAVAQPSTVIPARSRLKKFMPSRHNEKLKQAKNGNIDFVMIGDSITHNWERMPNYEETFAASNLLNLGFAGDGTQHVLWRLQHGAVDGISPKLVTLLIGTNNSADAKKGHTPDKPEDVVTGIQAIVGELRQRLPESKIIVFSIFPRKPGAANDRVKAVNAMLPQIADGRHVFHVDINDKFLDENGEQRAECYGNDLLHLRPKGYEAWSRALMPLLAEADLRVEAQPLPQKAARPKNVEQGGGSQAATGIAPDVEKPVIRLWPIEMVGGEENRLKEEFRDRKGRKQLSGIKDPNLTVFPADSTKPTPAVVYCPGGAYRVLGQDPKLIEWLNEQGITVFMLKYTIPDNPDAAFRDIQRAMRLVRHQASTWNVDPNNIGVVGQSAGGHLSARLSQNYTLSAYESMDEADEESCEPSFAILISAAYFLGRPAGPELDNALFHMKNPVAPTFLVYAKDDKFCKGGVTYEEALREAGFSTQIQLYEKGGHGLRGVNWFHVCGKWLKEHLPASLFKTGDLRSGQNGA